MLADRQGLLKGDLNDVQRAVLAYLIGREHREADEKETRSFKQAMMAAHPEKGREIEAMFEGEEEELAPILSDEEMDEAGPRSMNEIESMLEALKATGFAVEDMDAPEIDY